MARSLVLDEWMLSRCSQRIVAIVAAAMGEYDVFSALESLTSPTVAA
jgi:hypothetical protein